MGAAVVLTYDWLYAAHPAPADPPTVPMSAAKRAACVLFAALLGCIAGCVSPPPAPVAPPVVAAPPAPAVVIAPPPEPMPSVAPAAVPPPLATAAAPKETPLVDLPSYAKRGKRLAADGGAPGLAVLSYCRSFEIDKDAATYFKRLQKQNRLPTDIELNERNRRNGQADQALTVQQWVERDWALRRDNNKSVPQKCKVLGGSSESATAHIVFEADLNGRRQRGTATVTLTNGKWRLRDHGDWSPIR